MLLAIIYINTIAGLVRSVEYRSLGALGMPLALSLDWRFASSLSASAIPCRACAGVYIIDRNLIQSVHFRSLGALGMPLALSLDWRFASSLMASATPLPRRR